MNASFLRRGFAIAFFYIALTGQPVQVLAGGTRGADRDRYRNGNQGVNKRYVVTYGNEQGAIEAKGMAGNNVHKELNNHNAVAVTLPEAAMNALKQSPNIAGIEEDAKRYRSAEISPYGIAQVQADQVLDVSGSTTPGKKVCIIDSGYDLGHPDLPITSVSGYSNPSLVWSTPDDVHGTHVAGTIAAIGNNNQGVVGVNPSGNLDLYIVRVFDKDGWAYSSDLVDALDRCVDAGSNIVSMSLGGGGFLNYENNAFAQAYADGVLVVASAGNDGNNALNYPASYQSIVSVGAVDSNENIAAFSQFNNQVELAGPGVSVESTATRGYGRDATCAVAGNNYDSIGMEGSPVVTATANLVDCGLGHTDSTCSNTATNNICLIQRGSHSFADKVLTCQNEGGIGAIIYNNVAGIVSGTLGGIVTAIPSIGISDVDGATMKDTLLGQAATVTVQATNYAVLDGTSMACPHVSGVAALIWNHQPNCSATQIRNALTATAKDKGDVGKDNYYGYGIVQAKAAYDYLVLNGCPTPTPAPTPVCLPKNDLCTSDLQCCSGKCRGNNPKQCR